MFKKVACTSAHHGSDAGTLNGRPTPGATAAAAPAPKKRRLDPRTFLVVVIPLLVAINLAGAYPYMLVWVHAKTADSVAYATYTNQHGEYSVCFDPSTFSRSPVPDQDSVQTFISKDRSASFSILSSRADDTLAAAENADYQAYDAKGFLTTHSLQPLSYDIESEGAHEVNIEHAFLTSDRRLIRLKARYNRNALDKTYDAQFAHILKCFTSPKALKD